MSSKNILTIVISGLVILGVGFGIFWFTQSNDSSSDSSSNSNIAGYTDYSESKLSSAKSNVVFFHASWCPTCAAAEKDILSNKDKIPSNLQILKTDYDTSTSLKQKYGVTTQSTFVLVDEKGSEIKKTSGLTRLSDIVEFANVETVNSTNINSSTNSIQSESSTMNSSSVNNPQVVAKGEYTNYNSNLLSRANNGGKVVIFFNASWCPSCRSTVNNINSNLTNIPSNLTILSADYDKETELKKKYGVTTQHTFVQVDASGNQIKRAGGLNTLNDIVNFAI